MLLVCSHEPVAPTCSPDAAYGMFGVSLNTLIQDDNASVADSIRTTAYHASCIILLISCLSVFCDLALSPAQDLSSYSLELEAALVRAGSPATSPDGDPKQASPRGAPATTYLMAARHAIARRWLTKVQRHSSQAQHSGDFIPE